jgi:phage tail protein X
MRVKVLRQEMTVDLVVWAALGQQDDRLVERTLALNPGLADAGAVLPVGIEIELPDSRRTPEPAPVTRLFD